jgi:rifampicin phosphotransferase
MLMSSSIDTLRTLDDITPADRPLVGGKSYNCALLKQAGFPVPDGIVVLADAPDDVVRALLPDDPWLQSMPAGTRFAVRSSGTSEDSVGDSFAGIHDTHLNVQRDRVAEAVLACRRSGQSEQARAYRAARHLAGDTSAIAVLVQLMVPAKTSGVAFTVNPVDGADELVINSIEGLGEALVSGLVTPADYRLAKTDTSELAKLLVDVEEYYGAPQDIEWCHDGEQYWIVQSRPITTVASAQHQAPRTGTSTQHPAPSPGTSTQHPAPSTQHPEVEWTRANLAEVLPDQLSPQALDMYVVALDVAERAFFGRLLAPESELGPIIKVFHGRLYFNLSQLRHLTRMGGDAPASTMRSLGHSEDIRPEDEIATRPPIGALLRALPDILRLVRDDARAGTIFRRHQRRMDAMLARLNAADPATLSDADIWAMLLWWTAQGTEMMTPVFVMGNVGLRETSVRKACEAVGFSYDALMYPQLAAGPKSVSTQQAFDLVALSNVARREAAVMTYLLENDGTFTDYRSALANTAFLEHFDEFLHRYGHRGRYESDWALPRLHEQPAPALFAIRGHLQAPPQDQAAIAERQQAEAAAAWRAFEARLTTWQKWTMLPRLRSTIRRLKQQYLWREQVRSDLTRVLSSVRRWHLTLANRFVERGWIDRRDDYFLITLDEIGAAFADPSQVSSLRRIAAARTTERERERGLRMPLLMRESELAGLLRRQSAAVVTTDEELTGLCVSPGCVEAEVVVMRDPSEFAAMKRGAILVAPATDPSWTPLFTLASGVIVEVGGMLSHASTIAREYGLPALANVKDATRRLRTGDRIRLDASGRRATLVS